MAKDVNIKVKVEGGPEAKQQLDSVAKSADAIGQSSQQAGKDAGQGFGEATHRVTMLDRVTNSLQHSTVRMIAGFLGLHGVIRLIAALNDHLDKMVEKQKQLTEKSLTSGEGGQALEALTGTVGKQDYWAQQIASLQKTGGLESPKMALALMTKAQESFKDVGGIQNPAVAAMLQRLAPKLGAAAISESDLDRIFSEEEKAQEDAWDEAEKKREKHAKHYVKPPKPDFTVAAQDFESLLSKKLGVSDEQATTYMQSYLGRSRSASAENDLKYQAASPEFREWQLRMKDAEAEFDIKTAKGEENWMVKDPREIQAIALRSLTADLKLKRDSATGEERKKYTRQILDLEGMARYIENPLFQLDPATPTDAHKLGADMTRQPITINHNHITNHNPIVGRDPNGIGGRSLPEVVAP